MLLSEIVIAYLRFAYCRSKFDKLIKRMVFVVSVSSAEKEVIRQFSIIERNVNVLVKNLERLTTYSRQNFNEETQLVVESFITSNSDELRSLMWKLEHVAKTVDNYLELCDDFSKMENDIFQLTLTLDEDFVGLPFEEFEEEP